MKNLPKENTVIDDKKITYSKDPDGFERWVEYDKDGKIAHIRIQKILSNGLNTIAFEI